VDTGVCVGMLGLCGYGGLVWIWWIGVDTVDWCGYGGLVWIRWIGVDMVHCSVSSTGFYLDYSSESFVQAVAYLACIAGSVNAL